MSGLSLSIYDTAVLVHVVSNLKTSQNFLLDKFFPNIVTSDTEMVAIDVDIGLRRMAPFVSPLVEGKLVEQRRTQTNLFKPAYIKDKRVLDVRQPIRRQIGERIAGELSGAERAMANLVRCMTDQIDMLNRRCEWMASQVLQTGTVTIQGEGFPTVVVDFDRSPDQTIVLTGAAQWGVPSNFDAGGKDPVPAASIETWQQTILKNSGAVATDIVFTNTPWRCFLRSDFAQGAIYFPKLGDGGNSINPGPTITRGAAYKGRWGQYDLWLYNDWYISDVLGPDGKPVIGADGKPKTVELPMIPDGTVLMSGPDMEGTRAFGMILDEEANYQPAPFFPKSWVEKDPAQRLVLLQSSPIVIPSRVNAAIAAQVCAGATS